MADDYPCPQNDEGCSVGFAGAATGMICWSYTPWGVAESLGC